MLLKALAVLRTAFLAFIVYYTLSATPVLVGLPTDINEPYQKCKVGYEALSGAIWMAIGWIAFETLAGWWLATRAGRRSVAARAGAPPPASGEPPFAPPR